MIRNWGIIYKLLKRSKEDVLVAIELLLRLPTQELKEFFAHINTTGNGLPYAKDYLNEVEVWRSYFLKDSGLALFIGNKDIGLDDNHYLYDSIKYFRYDKELGEYKEVIS